MNDGGQAFPVWVPDRDFTNGGYVEGGMSLRDWFAGMALANLNLQAHIEKPSATSLAHSAYNIADAMLVRRV